MKKNNKFLICAIVIFLTAALGAGAFKYHQDLSDRFDDIYFAPRNDNVLSSQTDDKTSHAMKPIPEKELDETCKKVPSNDKAECLKFIEQIKKEQKSKSDDIFSSPQTYRGVTMYSNRPMTKEWMDSVDADIAKTEFREKYYAQLTKEQTDMLGIFSKFLAASADDTMRNGWTKPVVINYSEIQQSFTPQGWIEYQDYVARQKQRLIAKQGNVSEGSMNTWGVLEPENQSFSISGEDNKLFSEGTFSDGYYDARFMNQRFKLEVIYTVDQQTQKPLISSWRVTW